ncbi:MAG: 50S ribosomal protein L24 [Candidatus Komeilibacteria bacterium]|nr:50S ribosomal protein L24 [Candidatus Komeilibacteria bacterium]
MNIKKADTVEIITGKDKGKRGKVTRVIRESDKLVVEGLNIRIRHQRPRRQGEKGQRLEFPAPIHVSNVMLVDPRAGKTTRVGYKRLENGKKIRISKVSGEEI